MPVKKKSSGSRIRPNPSLTCPTHVLKREKVSSLSALDKYEKEKNCCSGCEQQRATAWGRPTPEDITSKAQFYHTLFPTSEKYNVATDEVLSFARARERKDWANLDRSVWNQFKDCERGDPYYLPQDYAKLHEALVLQRL
jgi:hypothetical protein